MTKVRAAVYTRKSSEEGLDQSFNSLDAQREACEAYITSQKSEGWTPVRTRYDDGGWSSGTMERPGLKQLLADLAAGRVGSRGNSILRPRASATRSPPPRPGVCGWAATRHWATIQRTARWW